jgi:hypothetical protein
LVHLPLTTATIISRTFPQYQEDTALHFLSARLGTSIASLNDFDFRRELFISKPLAARTEMIQCIYEIVAVSIKEPLPAAPRR